jgi:hypothetical protein
MFRPFFGYHQEGFRQIKDKTQLWLVMARMLAFSFSLSDTPLTTAEKKPKQLRGLLFDYVHILTTLLYGCCSKHCKIITQYGT